MNILTVLCLLLFERCIFFLVFVIEKPAATALGGNTRGVFQHHKGKSFSPIAVKNNLLQC